MSAKPDHSDLPPDIAQDLKRTEAALAEDRKRSGHFEKGRLLQIQVGDGYAYYEIARVGTRSVRLKWRGDIGLDDYQDAVLGSGGSFPRARIEELVARQDAWTSLFSGGEGK